MKNKFEMILAGLAAGRVLLHLAALAAGGRWRWHVAGIVRELRAGRR